MKWRKDSKDFTVSVTMGEKSHKCTIPKPIYEQLGEQRYIMFRVEDDGQVIVLA